ncbi:MAG: AAA family ATPase [Saprospiraceae bacterium]|jgi:AAA15 family ATPase/GTPase
MITRISIRNFRQIKEQAIDLSQSVVIIGPNNGGKTTLLQAISLFAIATKAWGTTKLNKKSKAQKRTGVAINLEEILNISVSDFKELWTDLIVREGVTNDDGKPIPKNIRIEIIAEGYTNNENWKTGFEFDYGRDSLIYARLAKDHTNSQYEFPEVILSENIGFLPSVAGLKPTEDKLEIGSILRYIGSGNTSDVLRNVCYLLYDKEDKTGWKQFVVEIESLFRIQLNPPRYIIATGLLKMTYNEGRKKNVDLSSLGSGTKQAILLFAYLLAFPNTVNLLDEPDAHLEVIRQSNIYDKISDIAKKTNSQLIVASHSESVMNRAFGKDMVISGMFGEFKIENQEKYIKSVLREIGYEEFIIAKQRPYILYFEGTTDLDFIKAYCKKLEFSEIAQFIEENVYPYPVGNDVNRMRSHFAALKNFIPNLKGYAIFDNLRRTIENNQPGLLIKQWNRNEIENYLPLPLTLYTYINSLQIGGIFESRFKQIVEGRIPPDALNDFDNSFWYTTKISDEFLTPIFEKFFDEMRIPRGIMDKSKFYQLVEFINPELIDQEIVNVIQNFYNFFTNE